jgi:hypothetical protein
MVTPEQLLTRGLRAYELGRFLAALRVALVVVPIAGLALIEATGRGACACLASVLLVATVWLRWRDRPGSEAVTTGLLAGSLPLLAGLVLSSLGLQCGLIGAESYCTLFSLLLGLGAGLLVWFRPAHTKGRVRGLLTALAIAGLAAGIGCVRLGTLGLVSMMLGLVLGCLIGQLRTEKPLP